MAGPQGAQGAVGPQGAQGATPAAHDIVGAQHTIAGAQYSVVGATALNTIGLLTPTVVSAANSLVMTGAEGYIRASQLEIGGTTYYIGKDGANILRIVAANTLALYAGAAEQMRLQDGNFFPLASDDVNLGTTTYRWKSVNGILANFSGLATLGGNFAMAANTSGYVPIADGTKFVAGAITKAMIPTHAHTYDKANSPTADGGPASPSAVRNGSGTALFYDTATGQVGTYGGAKTEPMQVVLLAHSHVINYTSTNSGTTII